MTTITRSPHAASAALNEAVTALKRGDSHAALSAARRATQQSPDEPDVWWVLSMVTYTMWLLDEGVEALSRGADLFPKDAPRRADFTSRRAAQLISLGRNAQATRIAREAMAIGSTDATHLSLFGNVLLSAGHAEEAIMVLSRAVTIDPQMADSWFRLARAREAVGDINGAEYGYEMAIRNGQHTGAHVGLARLRQWTVANNHIDRLLQAPTQNWGDTARIQNALFKEYDDLDKTDEAWTALEKANHAALNETFPSAYGIWGTETEVKSVRVADMPLDRSRCNVEAWKQNFPMETFIRAARVQPTTVSSMRFGPRRIFITGLPRSGTTLIERILAAHSQVQALGESMAFPVAVKRLSGVKGGGLLSEEIIAAAAQVEPRSLAYHYDHETSDLSDGSSYTIDKLPQNYEYAGLIRLAFPDAIIIEARREPMDSLFGTFKLLMSSDYPWIYRQEDLAQQYVNYASLMKHWRACVGDMIPVSLEALIANPAAQIRILLSACGLPFEPSCLTPHEAPGAVITSSSVQVRAPINAQGVGAWRKYKRQLKPLFQRLYEMGFIDEDGNSREVA